MEKKKKEKREHFLTARFFVLFVLGYLVGAFFVIRLFHEMEVILLKSC